VAGDAILKEEPSPAVLAPIPVALPQEPKPVRSLKRSERISVLPIEPEGPLPRQAQQIEAQLPTRSPLPVAQGLKSVRSLRKSEQAPLTAPAKSPPPDSPLPVQRHNADQIQELRRQEAISLIAPHKEPPTLTAHWALIVPGYLCAIAGGVCWYFYELRIEIPGACVACAWLIAAFIFFARPFSRHHAAFIAVIALFVTVFGALYYFPQLKHGA
jgi:hypothetical protein